MCYSDDTQFAVTGPREKLRDLQLSMEMLLKTLGTHNWFEQHGMKVSVGKTEYIVCGDQQQLTNIDQ